MSVHKTVRLVADESAAHGLSRMVRLSAPVKRARIKGAFTFHNIRKSRASTLPGENATQVLTTRRPTDDERGLRGKTYC